MPFKNTPETYGIVSKTLHWFIALAMIGMMVLGTLLEDMARTPFKFQMINLHKALGVTILFLALARLLWRGVNSPFPLPNPKHQTWEQKLSHVVHWALYFLMIAMPLSGWLLSGAANFPFKWFGLFSIPSIMAPNHDLAEILEEVHGALATGIWIVLGLHVAGALKHVFIDRDNTMRRMTTGALVFVALLGFAPALASESAAPTVWTINRSASTLSVDGVADGTGFTGGFKAFDGTINLTPEKPETGNASITIDLNSFDSKNAERDSTVKQPEWFDVVKSPTATFKVVKFEKLPEPGAFAAHGRLFLRGLERAVTLPFTLTVSEANGVKTAHAVGATSLKRLEFDVGTGDWADTKTVADDVKIRIDLTATAKSQ